MNLTKPFVSIEMSFLEGLAKLPPQTQKKANEMIAKFIHDPTSPGLNYEKIQAARDQKLHSIRVDQSYPRNDLFLVGDGHQNVYGHHIVLSQLGIHIRGRGRRLKLNYRTPEETRRWAVSILQNQEINDLDGGRDDNQGYHSSMSGPEPVFESFQTFDDEVKRIVAWHSHIRESNGAHVACVTVHTNELRQQYAQALSREGCPVHEITGESMDLDDPAPLRLATMDRIKGLEFDHVCLADCYPSKIANLPVDRQASQRCLLHVAATRTKNSLLIIQRK